MAGVGWPSGGIDNEGCKKVAFFIFWYLASGCSWPPTRNSKESTSGRIFCVCNSSSCQMRTMCLWIMKLLVDFFPASFLFRFSGCYLVCRVALGCCFSSSSSRCLFCFRVAFRFVFSWWWRRWRWESAGFHSILAWSDRQCGRGPAVISPLRIGRFDRRLNGLRLPIEIKYWGGWRNVCRLNEGEGVLLSLCVCVCVCVCDS